MRTTLPFAPDSDRVPERVPKIEPEEIARLPAVGDLVASKYRLKELIGQGGMGIVFGGVHEALSQHVAIKFLRPGHARDGESLRRFLREARAGASLRNAHAARVFDIGSTPDGVPFIVMERLRGENVDRVLELRGAFTVAAAVDCTLQVCEALAEAHAAGLVHRDLKPSNLFLLTEPGETLSVKVLDFGISKDVVGEVDGGESSLTGPNTVLGSPQYMAPEQVMAKAVDVRTDIWALGAILFELLTLRLPFDAESIPHLYALIVGAAPTPLRLLMPKAPAKLEAVILRCLEKIPANRPQDVGELATLLSPFASRDRQISVARIRAALEGATSARPSNPSPTPRPARRQGSALELQPTQPAQTAVRSRAGTVVGIGATALAVLIAAAGVWRRSLGDPGSDRAGAAASAEPLPTATPTAVPIPEVSAAFGDDTPTLAGADPDAGSPSTGVRPPARPTGVRRVRDLRGIKLLP